MARWDSAVTLTVAPVAAGREQDQKANCEMSGSEVAAGGAPDLVGHLPEMDVVPQGSGAPASSAQECWAEQGQQPEASVAQEAMVSPLVVQLACSDFQVLVLPPRDGHGFVGH